MRVHELWRYPVKSLRGEQLDAAEVGPSGIEGDRHWGIADLETGLVLTARRAPALLFASAALTGDGVAITLPDGTVTAADADLARWLGRPVALREADAETSGTYEIALDFEDEGDSEWFRWTGPPGSFHDSARTQVSLLSTASVGTWDPRRFRANVLLDDADEAALVGSTLAVSDARLDVVKPIDRCVITTRRQPGGIERDLDVLRTINRERGGHLGLGALVAGTGRIAVGDRAAVLATGA